MNTTLISTLWHTKRLWLLQLVLNALLLLAFWLWLGIPEAHVWEVAFSFLSAAGLVWMEFWLQCATLRHFQVPLDTALGGSFRRAASRVPIFGIWISLGVVLCWLALQAELNSGQLGGWLRHVLPAFLRIHVSPRICARVVEAVFGAAAWIAIPVIWLPVAARLSYRSPVGSHHAHEASDGQQPVRRLTWWIAYLILFVGGAYLPNKLVHWIPEVTGLRRQALSMSIRFASAYVLLITAWWIMAAVLGRRAGSADPDHGEVTGVREPVTVSPPQRSFGATAEQ
ncbi:MAG: hypothetical protein ABSD20_00265 [Terriglobales bacterium]|jgi:hypothetical protein